MGYAPGSAVQTPRHPPTAGGQARPPSSRGSSRSSTLFLNINCTGPQPKVYDVHGMGVGHRPAALFFPSAAHLGSPPNLIRIWVLDAYSMIQY
ncbi:hypothetical protein GGTG_12400 [Gaeumannomyces tritici R3-111a-1]|uniref:Uncharacterized protein n=1 Tax=Gaeumannomyces tritici (strain R3-111a-1) TaxID=644352 RepID=J3PFX5_GAET3|nr:hypothetical protein GGTG_12400 [Gaeumannomyces tritici R3-111a-1]EJT70227.1 hypothetical protein GGTG_12400 [Gaeumannomyces tritici R3-111a-1]